MVTEVNSDDVFASGMGQSSAVEQVRPVHPVNKFHQPPGDDAKSGKVLPTEESDTAVDEADLEDAARDFNDHAQMVQRDLDFSVDEDSGLSVIKVLDRTTQEVIRQIPGDEALRFARALREGDGLELFNTFT